MSTTATNSSTNAVKLVKLRTGEEIIGDTTLHLNGDINIKNIVMLAMVAQNQLGFVPYLPYCDFGSTGLKIKSQDVMFTASISKEMEKTYTGLFNKVQIPNGIVTPGNLKLTL